MAGDVVLFLIGGVGSSWNEILSAILFILTAAMVSRRGDSDGWFAAACALCIPAIILANLSELQAGSFATLIGTAIYIMGETLGAFSRPLTQAFRAVESKIIRFTLGEPRKWMGAISFSSKLFMLVDAVTHQHWGMLIVLVLWSIGDCLAGLSMAKVLP